MLKTNDSPPKILASQLFFLLDVEPRIESITDDMTIENVVVAVGKILHARQRLQEEVDIWARELFRQAGLPFVGNSAPGGIEREENPAPLPGLSVVPSQPAIFKTVAPPVPQKRRTRRIYLAMAIRLLERGSCTHRGLVDAIMERYPTLNRETVSTFVADVQNPIQTLKDCSVMFISLKEGIDGSGAYGQFMLTILAAISQLELEMITSRMKENRLIPAELLEWHVFYVELMRQLGFDPDRHYKPLLDGKHRWDNKIAEVTRKLSNLQASPEAKRNCAAEPGQPA